MYRSGTLEVARLQAKCRFVMPAKAGIHLCQRCKAQENLDSGLRRNDGTKSERQSTYLETLSLKPRVIQSA
jgi:hypothetical protein